MGEKKVSPASQPNDRNEHHKLIDPAFTKFFTQAPQKLQNFLKVRLRRPEKVEEGKDSEVPVVRKEQKSSTDWEANLEKQMQIWRENPFWHDQPPEIDVRVKSCLPREMINGSFVNLDERTCPFSMILTSMLNNQTDSFNILTLGRNWFVELLLTFSSKMSCWCLGLYSKETHFHNLNSGLCFDI